jgi:uncharacterized membrane protein YkoI
MMNLSLKTILPATAVAVALAAAGTFAWQAHADNDDQPWPVDAITQADVEAIVTNAGYMFEEAEFEDGAIEAEGTKDGVEWELTLDATTGEILKTEQDD